MSKEVKPAPAPGASRRRGPCPLERCHPIPEDSPDRDPAGKFDDEDYPAYSMGHAAEILGVTQAFLRSLDAAKLLTPGRSEGGHRRYSRYQLRLAARARELVDQGTALDSACRIIILEDQLAEARRINAELQHTHRLESDQPGPVSG
ncbi:MULTISPECIES: MerR family transcriptional regulator [unclassified Rhodococcus (in: high G+C Gram-positive bacteria)]|uniref:MerR family transcriptional regulator n=1 Tax=unclassified Rhodococcus (in: high G+C Gram-positive bacteria) TaxID=192944 RepID=UPI000300BF60|nr:MerR family transcriptional regulator [Rhodococcus sp. DK17]